MTPSGAAPLAAAICLAAAVLEGLYAGRGVRTRLEALRQPAHSPPFAGWVVIGIAYYAISFAVLFRLLRLEPSTLRAAALAAARWTSTCTPRESTHCIGLSPDGASR